MNFLKTMIITFLLTFWFSLTYGQESLYEFYPWSIHDTITSQNVIDKIKSKDVVKNSLFFFTREYDKEKGFFLIERKRNYWVVYNVSFFAGNGNINKHKTLSKRYISVDGSKMRSGWGENYYGWFVLFDLEKKTYLNIETFSHNSDDDKNHEKYINTRECNSKVTYKNGSLYIIRKCSPNGDKNYCSNCIESGEYKIVNNKLIKQ